MKIQKPKILFVCIENAGRSQMAEGFARKIAGKLVEPYSAGSQPSGKVNPLAIEVMKEKGIDISSHYSKGFNEVPVKEFDYVVTMGCGDVCPFVPGKYNLDWQIPNPKDQPIDYVRQVRDMIEKEVEKLLNEIYFE